MAALHTAGRVIEADNRHNTGLHRTERDEKEGLPFVIQAKHRNGRIRKGGQNQIQAEDVYRVGRLHQNIGQADPENLPDMVRIHAKRRGAPEALFHHHQRRDHLPRHGGNGGAGNAHARESQQTEYQQRVEQNIGYGSEHLRRHRRFHIPIGLQHLGPDALQKQPEAEYAHNAPVCHHIPDYLGRIRRHCGVSRHQAPAYGRKQQPERHGERSAHTGICVGLLLFSDAEPCRHNGVDANSRPHRNRNHQQLNRVNDRERGQPSASVIQAPDKHAVNNIVECLNQLGKHGRRRGFE